MPFKKKEEEGEKAREGEGRGERGREGKEKRKGRRGLVIGGIALLLVLGCNNGGELAAQKRLGEIGRSTEHVFYSFIDFIADTLGFRVTADTKKEGVGKYFSGLGEKIGKASDELEKVAEKAAADGDKDGLLSKAIKEAVDVAKTTLSALKGHVDSLGTVGGDSLKIGEAASNARGVTVDKGELKKTIDALKGIVELAKDSKVITDLKGSVIQMSAVKRGGSAPEDGAKILATAATPAKNDEGKAAAILSKVGGEEILEAIIASTGNESELSGTAQTSTTAAEFALGGSGAIAHSSAKVSSVAGGIALRSLIKNGKL